VKQRRVNPLKVSINGILPALIAAFNQSSGCDVYSRHAVLCTVVAMTSMDVMHISNYYIVDIMPVGKANFYIVLARCSSYFRV
jgi:hypothetical protein